MDAEIRIPPIYMLASSTYTHRFDPKVHIHPSSMLPIEMHIFSLHINILLPGMWCGKKKIFLNIKIYSTKPTSTSTTTAKRIIPYLFTSKCGVSKVQFSVLIRVIFMNSLFFAFLPFNTPTLHLTVSMFFICFYSMMCSTYVTI